MCRCGCRGWCSLYPLLDAWVCDLEQLQSSLKCVVLDIQCDWPAFLEVSGGRFWSHKTHPCPLCYVTQENLNGDELSQTTLDACPHAAYDQSGYLRDINAFTLATCLNQEYRGPNASRSHKPSNFNIATLRFIVLSRGRPWVRFAGTWNTAARGGVGPLYVIYPGLASPKDGEWSPAATFLTSVNLKTQPFLLMSRFGLGQKMGASLTCAPCSS